MMWTDYTFENEIDYAIERESDINHILLVESMYDNNL